ncbi:MAG: hypothetical protein HC853_03245 [Anaerolineae bacterium]|nr:hypothetical protein [Anaerolineae bacterium]
MPRTSVAPVASPASPALQREPMIRPQTALHSVMRQDAGVASYQAPSSFASSFEGNTAATPSSPNSSLPNTGETLLSGTAAPDIAALARQVYPLIKRLLAVERERVRGF